jgi:hypothetical protein
MSLRIQNTFASRSTELSSRSSISPIIDHIRELAKKFSLAKGTKVDGLKTTTDNGVQMHYATHILPLFEEKGVQFNDVLLNQALEVRLPGVYSPGTVTIAPDDSHEVGRYQAIIKDDDAAVPMLRYITHERKRERIDDMLKHVTLLTVLPKEVLLEAKKGGSVLIISTNYTEGQHEYEQDIPAQAIQLDWNEKDQLIEARQFTTNPKGRKDRIKKIRNTFFVLEEKLEQRSYDGN